MHETFEHKADIGVRGRGATLGEAFEECASAMFGVMWETKKLGKGKGINVKAEAGSLEQLLLNFLNELLYVKDVEEIALKKASVTTVRKGNGKFLLEGKVFGQSAGKAGQCGPEVKAATLHQLKVEKQGKGWVAQCVVDV